GAVDKLLGRFILPDAVKGLSKVKTCEIIKNFSFHHGGFTIHSKGLMGFDFGMGTKAVQKLELLSRFCEVFVNNLNFENEAYKLLEHLQNFTALAFSYKFHERDLIKFDNLAVKIIDICIKLGKLDEKKHGKNSNNDETIKTAQKKSAAK